MIQNCFFYIMVEDAGLICSYLVSTHRSFNVRHVYKDDNFLVHFCVFDVDENFCSYGSLIDDFVVGSLKFD